jgi:hypothetical protein
MTKKRTLLDERRLESSRRDGVVRKALGARAMGMRMHWMEAAQALGFQSGLIGSRPCGPL